MSIPADFPSGAGGPSAQRTGRILVLAGCFADADATIPLAVGLARLARAELTGVLAENPAAFDLPGGIVAPGGQLLRGVSAATMLAAYRADARAFRSRLAQAAAQAALGWQFLHERGEVTEILRRLAGQEDLALLAYRRVLRLRGPIVLLRRGGPQSAHSGTFGESMAAELARAQRLPLLELVIGDAANAPPGPNMIAVADVAEALRVLDPIAPSSVVVAQSVLEILVMDYSGGRGLQALIGAARAPILLPAAVFRPATEPG